MTLANIALSGKLGSGKSTCADVLMNTHGYRQLSFAAPLKRLVIEADPLVHYQVQQGIFGPIGSGVPVHLSDLLDSGKTFEECKREYPEVRRALQRIGQGARRIDPLYWVRYLLSDLMDVRPGVPVVVADMRYANEAEALRKLGFTLVRVERSQVSAGNGFTMDETRAMLHDSETALDGYRFDHVIDNNGSPADLIGAILDLVAA